MIKTLPGKVEGIGFTNSEFSRECDLCAVNKISATTLSKEVPSRSENKLDLVFSDACGPLPDSIFGSRYIISFIDDKSRFARVYFMKRKSKTLEKFKLYVAEFGMPKALRSDNAKEYFTADMTKFLVEKGIGLQQKSTSPYSPHQNGAAERYWRTINDMARTMLDAAHLPVMFWGRAVATSVFLRNRLSTSSLGGKTPF